MIKKKSILEESKELEDDWKAVSDLKDSFLKNAKKLLEKGDLGESQRREVLEMSQDLHKTVSHMYSKYADSPAAAAAAAVLAQPNPPLLKRCATTTDQKEEETPKKPRLLSN